MTVRDYIESSLDWELHAFLEDEVVGAEMLLAAHDSHYHLWLHGRPYMNLASIDVPLYSVFICEEVEL